MYTKFVYACTNKFVYAYIKFVVVCIHSLYTYMLKTRSAKKHKKTERKNRNRKPQKRERKKTRKGKKSHMCQRLASPRAHRAGWPARDYSPISFLGVGRGGGRWWEGGWGTGESVGGGGGLVLWF